MTKIKIFKDNTEIDLEKLIETRLIFFANSGGGKSWAFRKLLEEINNKVMVIIIDVEGEYKTLREKYDYLLIGGGGDIPINLKSATLLPKKLFEMNISAILDISELKSKDRIHYVKKFLEALMELPKELWKPCLVGVEETHKLCGQQDKHDSGPAVIDLFTRGRKRGLCGVAITQRIAKLHKDVVAECNNVFSGRMWLPNDIKTAAQILGMSVQEAMKILKNLEPGELFCFGPAINKNIHQGKIGQVKTTHPKMGIDLKKLISPPTDKIKKILSKLSRLPQKAEEELKEKGDYLRKIHELETKLRRISRTTNVSVGNTRDMATLKARLAPAERNLQIQKHRSISFEKEVAKWKSQYATLKAAYDQCNTNLKLMERRESACIPGINILKGIYPTLQRLILVEKNMRNFFKTWEKTDPLMRQFLKQARSKEGIIVDEASDIEDIEKLPEIEPTVKEGKGKIITFGTEPQIDAQLGLPTELTKLPKAAGVLYKLLVDNPGRTFTVTQAAAILGYSPKTGHFTNTLYVLTSNGLIVKEGKKICADEMRPELIEGLPKMEISMAFIKSKLPKASRAIFELLLDKKEMDKEDIAIELGYSYDTGHFTNSIYKLTSMELVKKEGKMLKLNPEIEELI